MGRQDRSITSQRAVVALNLWPGMHSLQVASSLQRMQSGMVSAQAVLLSQKPLTPLRVKLGSHVWQVELPEHSIQWGTAAWQVMSPWQSLFEAS